jgi:hypothetical protein
MVGKGLWGPNTAAALDELRRRGYLVDRMAPLDVIQAMNREAGAYIPENEELEKAAALWLAALREMADE